MSRVVAYCQASTPERTTDNQVQKIAAAGFTIYERRIITKVVSGSQEAMKRPGFSELKDKLEEEDMLVVTKLDRLGRNAMDVRSTVESLAAMGVRVHCLALGGVDLTSATGKMTMQVLAAVAEFKRDLLIERTQAGLARAKSEGKHCDRPPALAEGLQVEIRERIAKGESVATLAKAFKTSRQTIMRIPPIMPPTSTGLE